MCLGGSPGDALSWRAKQSRGSGKACAAFSVCGIDRGWMNMRAEILILAALLSRPMHGYEIKKAYDQTLGGLVTLHHNQLYPALRRFEAIGAVRCEAIEQQGRPDRL